MVTDIGIGGVTSNADGVGCGGATLFLGLLALILIAFCVLSYLAFRDVM